MFGSIFRKSRKRPSGSASSSLGESIKEASVGDVFTITGLSIEYEDSYFIVEKIDRHESGSGKWHELLGLDGDKKLWVQWSDDGGLFVTATPDRRPMGIKQLDLASDDLVRLDEEQSVDDYVTYEGTRYYYKHSNEAYYYKDNSGDGVGYYLWEFMGEGDDKVLSIHKWEETPFEVYLSEVVSPDSISLYKR